MLITIQIISYFFLSLFFRSFVVTVHSISRPWQRLHFPSWSHSHLIWWSSVRCGKQSDFDHVYLHSFACITCSSYVPISWLCSKYVMNRLLMKTNGVWVFWNPCHRSCRSGRSTLGISQNLGFSLVSGRCWPLSNRWIRKVVKRPS